MTGGNVLKMPPRLRSIARLLEIRARVFRDMERQIAAGMPKPPAAELWKQLTHRIERLQAGGGAGQ